MIANSNLESLRKATHRYTWRQVPLVKNPFDLALMPKLLWTLRPSTVFEFGSYLGGSAIWISDLLRAFGLKAGIYSVDKREITLPESYSNGVVWIQADIRTMDLGSLMDAKPHPWLVIEDSDHNPETVERVLRTFAPAMEPGDRFIVEDGVLSEMGKAGLFGGGPAVAIERFMKNNRSFKVDRDLCDFWGPNVTFNPDGYLVKIEAPG